MAAVRGAPTAYQATLMWNEVSGLESREWRKMQSTQGHFAGHEEELTHLRRPGLALLLSSPSPRTPNTASPGIGILPSGTTRPLCSQKPLGDSSVLC
ncbi:hypothetical protein P7K49_037049 [Saguinus oedipus]|uniref:Uncharacterized protein n=1 Tax=Saguinus oedipus TaxID=9490 RepID=A0ABQ9TM24_SAGOE|nr:hypothetical protein P7K49_037049 [Saguinus oedipus]